MRHLYAALFAAFIFIILLSCQSSDSPAVPGQIENSIALTLPGPVLNRSLWGYFNLEADLENGTVTSVPDRSSQVHINAVAPLNNSLGLIVNIDPSSEPASGYFVIDIGIVHPFNNPSLCGFDVRGILLTTGELNAGGLKIAGPNDPVLENADGWTRWWNPTEFTTPGLLGYTPGMVHTYPPGGSSALNATVNPYKMYGDALYSTSNLAFYKYMSLTDASGRAIFKSGKTNFRLFKIQFPLAGGPKVYFDYAVDASWAPATVKPPQIIPSDFPMEANCPEAFILEPSISFNNLASTPFGGVGMGQVELDIEVFDWQGWANNSYNGQIGEVHLYSPYVDFATPSVTQEPQAHSVILNVTAPGTPSTTGTVPVLVEVRSPGTNYKQGSSAAPNAQIAAYYMIKLDVAMAECTSDENQVCDDAQPLGLHETATGAVCSPLDAEDYYSFVIPSGSVMSGTVNIENYSYSDTDMFIYDGCPGNIIASSLTSGTVDEVLDIDNIESGIYYITVLPGESATGAVQPYKIILDINLPADQCTTDNNNEYHLGSILALQDNVSETVCAGFDLRDWFRIFVPNGQVCEGTMYVDNKSTGDINIKVYDVYPGYATFWSINPNALDELLIIPGLGPGTHYIEIYAQGSAPEGNRPYDLNIDLVSVPYDCTPDGNDSPLTANPISITGQVSDSVCFPGDPDWFLFNIPSNKSASGVITLNNGLAYDNDLFLYGNPNETPLQQSVTAGFDNEQISLSNLETGTYYLKVSAHPAVGLGDQPYTLTMNLTTQNIGNFDITIHAHIITETGGSNPATSESKVQNDVNWADSFWGQYGGSVTLVAISYIPKSSWLTASSNEMVSCHNQYRDTSGPINIYYVNGFSDMDNAAAYAIMYCRFNQQTHNTTYSVMSDWGDGHSLGHELGHCQGMLVDTYLLDYYTCSQLAQMSCPYPPNNTYCSNSDDYAGNLMYWTVQNWTQPWQYELSDTNYQTPASPIESQAENWSYFHTNYPNNF